MFLNDEIETFLTQDGSIGLYNKKLDEIYHSKFGAKKEAYDKFINPAKIIDNHPLNILDICYGIGYNTKTALKYYKNIKTIDCIEIDESLVLKSSEFEFDEDINKIIDKNIKKADFINFYIQDARIVLKNLNKKYDIVFHDGFAPHKQAQLWSEDFIFLISKLLKKDGIYTTYNHSKPVLNALFKAGLKIGKVIENDKQIATIASFSDEFIKNPLNDYEIGMLNAKSAITYKDKNLDLDHNTIILNRNNEIKYSSLPSLSSYIKNYSK